MALKDGGGDVESQLDELDGLLDLTSEEIETASSAEGSKVEQGGGGEAAVMFGNLLVMLSAVFAARRGQHWNLTEMEGQMLGGAVAAFAAKYAPNHQGGVEFTLIMTVLAVFAPKLAIDASIAKESKQTGKIEDGGGKGGDTSKSQSKQ